MNHFMELREMGLGMRARKALMTLEVHNAEELVDLSLTKLRPLVGSATYKEIVAVRAKLQDASPEVLPKKRPRAEQPSDDLLSIDLNQLHLEWAQQPKRYMQVAEQLADAQDAQRQAEADLEVAWATVAADIRDSPLSFGLTLGKTGAPTVDAIKECVVLQDDHKKALRHLNQCKHKVDLLKGLLTALDHRKKALEKTVDLRLANYFAEPSTRGREALQEDIKQSTRRRGQQ